MSRLPPPFGPFEPVQRLGAGGMAETFVAVRRGPAGFEQRVCIKRILPAYESDPEFVQAFLREARTSAQLRHANIVQVLDFGLADESHYLALELIDGVDLRALVKGSRGLAPKLSADLVTLVACDVALALDHAHRGGQAHEPIVHRDISPSNVLASRAGEIKLTDFGIARAIGPTRQTATGVIKGKVPYLPPEYIERGVFEARSDLFALGVMLYELLAGQRPFDGDGDFDTVRRIVAGDRPRLSALAPDAPRELVDTIERLLSVDLDGRPASALAVVDTLPQIAVHRARLKLGELVRAELGELATLEAASPSLRAAAQLDSGPRVETVVRTPTPRPASAVARQETRTHDRPAARGLSRGAKLSALCAGLALCTVAALLVARGLASQAVPQASASPPPLPKVGHAPSVAAATQVPVAPPGAKPGTPSGPPSDAERPADEDARAVDVRIVVIPFGEVWVDDKLYGPSPINARLAPGSHDVGWGDGRPEEHRTLRVEPGKPENVVYRRRGVPTERHEPADD